MLVFFFFFWLFFVFQVEVMECDVIYVIDRGDHGEGAAKYRGALLVSMRHVCFLIGVFGFWEVTSWVKFGRV